MTDQPSNAERIASTISPVDPWPALTEILERMEDDDDGQD